jgi:hypothetical protein
MSVDAVYRDGRQMDVGADGLSRIRKLHADRIATFNITHPGLSATDKTTLESHYSANATLVFNYTSPLDGVTYSVSYASRPHWKAYTPDATRQTANVTLTQTA